MHCLISCVILLGSYMSQASAQDLVQNNFLVVVADIEHRSNLYKIDLQSGAMNPLLTSTTFNLAAVAFDPVEKVVYWTDVKQRLIGKISVDGSRRNPAIIFDDPSGKSDLYGLTLDIENRKLYYADSGNFSKIVEMNLDGSGQFSIVNETGMKPWAMVVDTQKRAIYYTDWGVQPGIHVIDLSTYQRTAILTDRMRQPTALAIDFEERVMYWADAQIDSIQMANLDGSGRVTLATERNATYIAMALSPQYLYITDLKHNALKRLNRKTHIMSEQKPEVLGTLYGIVYYNSSIVRDRCNSAIPIDHTMVWIVAVTVGALVSITAMIALNAYHVAKRRRERVNAGLHYMNPMEHTLANPNEFTGDRSSHHYECITPFDTTTMASEADDKEKY